MNELIKPKNGQIKFLKIVKLVKTQSLCRIIRVNYEKS